MPPSETHEPTVYIVDDDVHLRESLRALLSGLDLRVCVFAAPGDFRSFYRAEMPGCLLLDVCLPRQSGLDLHRQLLSEGIRIPTIFMSAHADVSTAVAAMKAGAIDFLEKPFDCETLSNQVHRALQLDGQWREHSARITHLAGRIASLTDRERETLALLQTGASNKSMAAQLFLSERAVEMRRSAIMRKLKVANLAELLELTITHRILSELPLEAIVASRCAASPLM